MGVTNIWGQKAFNKIGSARAEIYDEYLAAWIHLGRTSGQTFRPATQTVQQRGLKGGRMVVTQERPTEQTASLGITLAENWGPLQLQLMFGDKALAQTAVARDVASTRMSFSLYNLEEQIVSNPVKCATYDTIPAPTVAGTPLTGGGSVAADTYYFWVQAIYGTVPTTTTYSRTATAGVDVLFTASCPGGAAAGVGTASNPSGATAILAGTGNISLVITPSATAPTPDGYVIWVCDSDDLTLATALYTGTATTYLWTTPVFASLTGDTYVAAVGAAFLEIDTYGTTPTYTLLSQTIDVAWDASRGVVKRRTGGTVNSGDQILGIVWNVWAAGVTTTIGGQVTTQDYRKIRFVFLEEEVDGTRTPTECEGGILTVDKAQVAGLAATMSFSETDFSDGSDVEFNCVWDETNQRIGTVTSYSPKFESWAQKYL